MQLGDDPVQVEECAVFLEEASGSTPEAVPEGSSLSVFVGGDESGEKKSDAGPYPVPPRAKGMTADRSGFLPLRLGLPP